MTAVDTLAAWGIVNPAQVVAIAAATGLPLALACSLLDQESGGGHNVWGHDGGRNAQTGGVYVPGAPVTRQAYEAYKRLADTGVIHRQGVGPCQLTARTYQDAADARGGCWDWTANVTVGFSALVALTNRHGLPDGVRRYNGSGPAAEAYRDKMMDRYRSWTTKLGPVVTTGDDDMQPDERAALLEVRDALRAAGIGKGRLPGRSPGTAKTSDDAFGWILSGAGFADEAADGINALRAQVADLAQRIPALPADWPTLLAAALVAHVTGGTPR